jgi:GNAT superfamily N-acetyltransferase
VTDNGAAIGADIAAALADMHRQSLAFSTLGRMGRTTLERYYRWVGRSATEHLFVERDANTVVAAAVLSLHPFTLVRRFVRAAPLAFALEAARAFARDAAFRREALGFFSDRSDSTSTLPEIVQIFVSPDQRGRKTGTRLLGRVEEWLKAHQQSRYYVRTLAENNAATLGFYRGRGFVPTGETIFCGTRYIVLERAVE